MTYILPKSTKLEEALDKVRDNLKLATKCVDDNKECFIALWVLQNPDANLEDYILCCQHDWTGNCATKMWLEKKQ